MSPTKVQAQFRHIGTLMVVLPLASGIAVAVIGVAVAGSWTQTQTAIVVTWLSQVFTIAVGIAATVTMTGDPIVELHESTPTSFRAAQLSRAAIVLLMSVIAAVTMFAPLHARGVWPRDVGWFTVFAPASTAVFVVALALMAAAFSKSASTTAIGVIAGWMFVSLVWEPYVDVLAVRCGVLLSMAAGLAVVAAVRLGDSEKNISRVVTV